MLAVPGCNVIACPVPVIAAFIAIASAVNVVAPPVALIAPPTVNVPPLVTLNVPEIVDAFNVNAFVSTKITLFPLVIATVPKLFDA